MRLFTAIYPPEHIVRKLTRLQKGVSGARWSEPEKLHITTGFYGDLDAEYAEILDHHLGQIRLPGFDLSLSGAGHFGKSEPHSIWVGVDENDSLSRLHMACRRAARQSCIDMESREFRPHVTLAYMRGEVRIDRIVAFEKRVNAFKAGPFLVDQFHLVSSWQKKTGGNLYKIEASYPLYG